jgi:hypothetical protein
MNSIVNSISHSLNDSYDNIDLDEISNLMCEMQIYMCNNDDWDNSVASRFQTGC